VWAAVTENLRICDIDHLFAPGGKTKCALQACTITYLTVLSTTFFYRGASFSRIFVALSALMLFALTLVSRVAFRVALNLQRRRNNHQIHLLVIGADEYAHRAAHSLVAGEVMPCTVVGFVRLPGQRATGGHTPTYEMDDISRLAINNGIDDAVLAIPPDRLGEIPLIIQKLEPLCVPLRLKLDLGDDVVVRKQLLDFGGTFLLDLRSTPAESPMYSLLKRGFDIIFSLLMIILTLPLMALIALAIFLTSPGPALFVQDRVGLNGKVFPMFKFRTMYVGEQVESDTRWTVRRDPRCTKLGRFLRRTNLDELPQFFNVLKGDMSVVGPRPERPFFVQKFLSEIAKYNSRHFLKVGITGWAQVNGYRGDSSIAKRVECDLYYLRNWSFTFDLQIILQTVLRGFTGKNAY
jgi:Undecaprenyl-phosphate glucose phosphotransferase